MITSIHDLLNAQGHFPRQRFVEYFSGKQISAIWTRTESGTGTQQMEDAIDDGFSLYPASLNTNYTQINHNNINHFSKTSSVLVIEWKQATHTGGASNIGMWTTNTS